VAGGAVDAGCFSPGPWTFYGAWKCQYSWRVESNIKDFEVSTNAIATIISTTILKFCHNIMVHSISVTVTETVI
jgi:hypothetical protein